MDMEFIWDETVPDRGNNKPSRTGDHLRGIDVTLPSRYTRRLHGTLPRSRSYLLTPTANRPLLAINVRYSAFLKTTSVSAVQKNSGSVIVDCPRLKLLRQTLRRKVDAAFRSVSL
jgi:hypothetical protein